jgi:hypothetical protein
MESMGIGVGFVPAPMRFGPMLTLGAMRAAAIAARGEGGCNGSMGIVAGFFLVPTRFTLKLTPWCS